jgi:sigma-E factor negative regulatory protein RseC
MYEIGIVKSIDGTIAKVVVARKSSCCESCEKEICDIPENGVETEAVNTAGAKVGQKVKVVMKSYTYVKGAMIIYVLPVVALIAGAILGKMYLPSFWGGVDSDLLAALAGFLTLFTSLILVKIISSRMDKKTENKSVIESVVEG